MPVLIASIFLLQNQMGVPRTPTRAPQSPFAQNTRMPFSQSPGQFNQLQQQQQFGSPQTGFPNQSPMSSPSTRGKAPGFGKAASNIKSEQDESVSPHFIHFCIDFLEHTSSLLASDNNSCLNGMTYIVRTFSGVLTITKDFTLLILYLLTQFNAFT